MRPIRCKTLRAALTSRSAVYPLDEREVERLLLEDLRPFLKNAATPPMDGPHDPAE
jgi:hypothetical protein